MNTNKITARMFRYVRTSKGMSQIQMAKALGVNQSTICRIEMEEIFPNTMLLKKVRSIAGLDLESLVQASNR